ncbi:hypothetical protein I6A60_24415 [Frankia sp. AgB1.9]|uniref:hypothetical protein n=1 Tax=unclassified Frankia TaxID=2632575 RepID=UPI00193329ED|nr:MULTISPECIES: hypothetical protein [unclassified Frankia]MBL7494475.1 hypothetical protein [Frankia sp. AgW1.1]MBL7550985.1 hypothetical protein [Frankia sp. AgB1.9]MBL7623629.1 hypothetical protein [Frankia sp. AgB1.8]
MLVEDILSNIAVAGAGLIFGRAQAVALTRWRFRQLREFWKPMAAGERVVLIVDAHEKFKDYEPSGMGGIADMQTLLELDRHLRSAGLRSFEFRTGTTLTSQERRRNLILIGAADANRITREVTDSLRSRLPLQFRVPDDEAIIDPESGGTWESERNQNVVTRDYALVIFAKSPFAEGSFVLILAGIYGYGTRAAQEAVTEESLVKELSGLPGEEFVALISCNVVNDSPQKVRVVQRRKLYTE